MTLARPSPGSDAPAAARRIDHLGLMLVVAGTSLMIVLDATIVNVALPSMGRYFQRSQTEMTWVVNAYTITLGGLLLLGARSGDIFGRRRMLTIGLALFSAGSLAGGLSRSFELLLAARVLEGTGAAIAGPIALSLITTGFEEGRARNRAIAVYAAISGGGAAIGLLLGGALTEYASWRWVLIVNVPLGLALIVGAFFFLGDDVIGVPTRSYGRIDFVGAVVSIAGLAGLVYGFIHAGDDGWGDLSTIAILTASIAVLAAFVGHELFFAPDPIAPLRILRDRNRGGAYVIILIVQASLIGLLYFINFFAQDVLGYSALRAGLAFLPALAIIALSTQTTAMLLGRVGAWALIVTGTVVMSGALVWLSTVTANSGYVDTVLPATALFGIGLGLVLVPLTTLVMSRISPTDAGLASGVLNVAQQVGGSVGLAVLASIAGPEASRAATTQAKQLLAQYGLSAHVGNFLTLVKSLAGGPTPPPAAAGDPIAVHAIDVLGAQADGLAFAYAAIFSGIAVVVSIFAIGRSGHWRRTAERATIEM